MVLVASLATVACDSDSDGDEGGIEGGIEGGTVTPPVLPDPAECNTALDCQFNRGALDNVCQEYVCSAGTCLTVPAPLNRPCGAVNAASCSMMACDGAGTCGQTAAFDMTPCGDSDGCVGSFCIAGGCITDFAIVQCDDINPCTDDICEAGVCVFVPNSDPCDDGDACTTDDTCDGGICRGTPTLPCPCTADAQCLPDGNFCNGVERCIDGFCTSDPSTAIDCSTSADSCRAGLCNPVNGVCSQVPLPNGTPCDDGDPCTENDTCINQQCVGQPVEDCEIERTLER